MRMDGFDEVMRSLKRLEENARALDGKHSVPLGELFPPEFMRRHTQVASFEALMKAGGFEGTSEEDFAAIPDSEWEAVIRSNTSFDSWDDMKNRAGAEYVKRRLTDGV